MCDLFSLKQIFTNILFQNCSELSLALFLFYIKLIIACGRNCVSGYYYSPMSGGRKTNLLDVQRNLVRLGTAWHCAQQTSWRDLRRQLQSESQTEQKSRFFFRPNRIEFGLISPFALPLHLNSEKKYFDTFSA